MLEIMHDEIVHAIESYRPMGTSSLHYEFDCQQIIVILPVSYRIPMIY